MTPRSFVPVEFFYERYKHRSARVVRFISVNCYAMGAKWDSNCKPFPKIQFHIPLQSRPTASDPLSAITQGRPLGAFFGQSVLLLSHGVHFMLPTGSIYWLEEVVVNLRKIIISSRVDRMSPALAGGVRGRMTQSGCSWRSFAASMSVYFPWWSLRHP